jgi:hypothetical protein
VRLAPSAGLASRLGASDTFSYFGFLGWRLYSRIVRPRICTTFTPVSARESLGQLEARLGALAAKLHFDELVVEQRLADLLESTARVAPSLPIWTTGARA